MKCDSAIPVATDARPAACVIDERITLAAIRYRDAASPGEPADDHLGSGWLCFREAGDDPDHRLVATVARRRGVDCARRTRLGRRKEVSVAAEPVRSSAETDVFGAEIVGRVLHLVGPELGLRLRGLTFARIADAIGCPLRTAHQRVVSNLERIRMEVCG